MEHWHYEKNNQAKGPIPKSELLELIHQGKLTDSNLVWTSGMGDWKSISSIPELQFNIQSEEKNKSKSSPPPPLDTETKPDSNKFNYAGFWFRAGALFIDTIIFTLAYSVLLISTNSATTTVDPSPLASLFSLFGPWLYFAIMESSNTQATLGKMALGLRVTDLSGNKIGFGKATGRYFGKIISSFILLIGYFMAGFTKRKQTLHDMMANCLVIKK